MSGGLWSFGLAGVPGAIWLPGMAVISAVGAIIILRYCRKLDIHQMGGLFAALTVASVAWPVLGGFALIVGLVMLTASPAWLPILIVYILHRRREKRASENSEAA